MLDPWFQGKKWNEGKNNVSLIHKEVMAENCRHTHRVTDTFTRIYPDACGGWQRQEKTYHKHGVDSMHITYCVAKSREKSYRCDIRSYTGSD